MSVNEGSSNLETSFSFGMNHKERARGGVRSSQLHGNQPVAYLGKFLEMFRPFGYATADDSWGELEKLLDIVHREAALNRFREASAAMAEARKQVESAEKFCDDNLAAGWRGRIND